MIPEAMKERPDPDRLIEELLEAGWTMPMLEIVCSRYSIVWTEWTEPARLLHLPKRWHVMYAFKTGMINRRKRNDEVGNYLLELSAKIAAAHQTATA